MRKILFSALLIILIISNNAVGQDLFLNRVFQDASGSPVFNPILNPLGVQWSKTIKSASGGIIMVGYTSVTGQGQNIYLIKYSPTGTVLFQTNYNTSGSNNDYGTGVYEATNGDIYACGSTDNGGTTNYDAVILRFGSNGTLLNSATKNGVTSGNDDAVSIIKDASGNIIVAANTAASNGTSDMWILKYTSALSFVSSNTYDYAGLNDFALGLSIASNTIKIIGPSASSATAADYVQVNFNLSSLAYISETRNNVPGTALDQALDFCKDANDNTYITGKAWNGTNFDIKTIKINANFTMGWTVTYNPYGLEDAGTTIIIDGSGNIIVGGYITKSNNVKDLICLKYNASNGSLTWLFQQSSKNPSGDAMIKQICTNPSNDAIYFVGVEKSLSGNKQVLTGKITSTGKYSWQRNISGNVGQDYLPSDIKYDTDGIYVISIKDSLTSSYLTTKYSELELDTVRKFIGGSAVWKSRELLVSFSPSAINKAAINNQVGTKISEFGNLSDFLTTSANTAVNNAFGRICPSCDIKAIKVYDAMKTTDTMAISRLGDNVPVPAFWSTLLLQFPSSISVQQAQSAFKSISNIVSYTQPNNFMVALTAPPNDSLYSSQASLHSVSPNTNAHINVEEAWDVVTGCGARFVKGGVFDTGVEWLHRDFGYNGSQTSGKIQGWHFGSGFSSPNGGVDIRTTAYSPIVFDYLDHGTPVAGIIGAQRNNTSGIAGIAGGDGATNNSGVSLYSLNVQATNMYWLLKAYHEAHKGGSSTPYSYGVHFSNHSYKMVPGWWPVDSFPLLREEVHFANRMGVTFIVSRGNDSTNNFVAPANYDSCWVISAGASGSNGLKWSGSSYGSGMDVIAPGVTNIVTSTSRTHYYKTFSGTSAAAPHVSGVVALLMSYMNDTVPSYKNLAPEDCDYIIQHSATDVGPSGYDSINGYGRLNAGKALRMVEKPIRTLYHFGTNAMTPHTITKSVYSNVDTIRLTEKYSTPNQIVYSPGKYIVKTFQINASVSHPGLYPTDSLMHHWPRHSSSYVYDLPNAQKKLNMHERVKINSLTGSGATLTGYIYQVRDSVGTPLGWWPCDTTFAVLFSGVKPIGRLMEYSVLSKNKAVGIKEINKEDDNITVYPNPASHKQTIVLASGKESDCKIELYDMMGRYVKMVYNGKASIGKTSITHNLENLPNSMYIYIISLDGKISSKKFIKQ